MMRHAEQAGADSLAGRALAIWCGAAALMVLPVIAIRAADAKPSDVGDFMFLAILLVISAGALGIAAVTARRRAYAVALGMAVATGCLQVWVNFAVGIVGNEDNPANWIYVAVVGVALVGALVGRFQPSGMARAMQAAAIAQAATFIVALIGGWGFTGPITIFFVLLWLTSGWLFQRSAEMRRAAHES